MKKERYLKEVMQKGFTLIELLVVIAIISLLATVVFASLGSTRDKSKDAAAKENMINLRSISELYYLENGNSYTGFCQDSEARAALNMATSTTGLDGSCDVDIVTGEHWAAEIELVLGDYFCIDTRGGGKIRTASKNDAAPITECPAN
ncbi:MAG: type II secretion system protein [Candidatus Pacebacteria bacterium]|nr:type II secretion system protein [Candidatus Paceibacterota bacterium]